MNIDVFLSRYTSKFLILCPLPEPDRPNASDTEPETPAKGPRAGRLVGSVRAATLVTTANEEHIRS